MRLNIVASGHNPGTRFRAMNVERNGLRVMAHGLTSLACLVYQHGCDPRQSALDLGERFGLQDRFVCGCGVHSASAFVTDQGKLAKIALDRKHEFEILVELVRMKVSR